MRCSAYTVKTGQSLNVAFNFRHFTIPIMVMGITLEVALKFPLKHGIFLFNDR